MKIYGSPQGGNPVRVAIFCAEKGIEPEYINVDLFGGEHRSEKFRAMNPFSRIPVLETEDGHYISETLAICRYLERLQPEPNLMGRDALEEATIEMWQRRIEFELYAPVQAVLRHSLPHIKALEPVQIKEWAELNRPRIDSALEIVDQHLANQEFLACERFSVADITLLFTTQMLAYIKVDLAGRAPNVARWQSAVMQRPAVQEVLAK